MKIGDLVKTKRAMLGIPIGSYGIIINTKVTSTRWIHKVQFIGSSLSDVSRTILSRDLEVVA